MLLQRSMLKGQPAAVNRAQRRSTMIRLAVQSPEQELYARAKLSQASKDLHPYMLWDRVLRLSASWDTRSQADFKRICEVLQPRALDKITITKAEDGAGQPLTCLTVVCKPEDGEDLAAALLQWTPATHVTAAASEQCYLPQCVQQVTTSFGTIDVQLSLAGSSVRKVTPNWAQCQAAAEAAAADGVDAAAVAAAAVEQLNRGLEDGSIHIDAHLMF